MWDIVIAITIQSLKLNIPSRLLQKGHFREWNKRFKRFKSKIDKSLHIFKQTFLGLCTLLRSFSTPPPLPLALAAF